MHIIGIDENGLGPVLGPMVVTAAHFEAPNYNAAHFWKLHTPSLPTGDSKKVFKRQSPVKGENAIIKWLNAFSIVPDTTVQLRDELLIAVAPPCPDNRPICELANQSLSLPRWSKAGGNQLENEDQQQFSALNIVPHAIAADAICTGRYNQLLANGDLNKLQLDFDRMLTLLNRLTQNVANEPILCLCGKVGGTTRYIPWFEAAGYQNVEPIIEERDESVYKINNTTEIHFIKDGDDTHLPIAVASMVGKYLRETQMEELNALLNNSASPVSGYRDKKTKSFIETTLSRRSQLNLPERCFTRNS